MNIVYMIGVFQQLEFLHNNATAGEVIQNGDYLNESSAYDLIIVALNKGINIWLRF